MLVCPVCKRPTRVGMRVKDVKGEQVRVRVCKREGAAFQRAPRGKPRARACRYGRSIDEERQVRLTILVSW